MSLINDCKAKIDVARTAYKTACSDALTLLLNDFFDKNSNIKTIHWLQYTPYFNDGDECVFSVYDIFFSGNEWGNTEPYEDEEEEPQYDRQYASQLARLMMNDLEDTMRDVYGNHVWVRVHRDGHEIEEYEHD